MKRILCLILCVFMLFLVGCSAKPVGAGQGGASTVSAALVVVPEEGDALEGDKATDGSQGEKSDASASSSGDRVVRPRLKRYQPKP